MIWFGWGLKVFTPSQSCYSLSYLILDIWKTGSMIHAIKFEVIFVYNPWCDKFASQVAAVRRCHLTLRCKDLISVSIWGARLTTLTLEMFRPHQEFLIGTNTNTPPHWLTITNFNLCSTLLHVLRVSKRMLTNWVGTLHHVGNWSSAKWDKSLTPDEKGGWEKGTGGAGICR